jgi:hypothetical protein
VKSRRLRFLFPGGRGSQAAEHPPTPIPEPEEPAPEPAPPAPDPHPPTPEPARANPQLQWNLWELERLAQASATNDGARAEELDFLLRELRPFANAEGRLPVSFDPVVRESFGDLVVYSTT